MNMKPYRVVEVLTLRPPTLLALSAQGQHAARKAALKATDAPGVFEVLTEVQFKKGELIGLPGELPKGMDRFLEPADGPPKLAASRNADAEIEHLRDLLNRAYAERDQAVADRNVALDVCDAFKAERDAMAGFLSDDQKAAVALAVAEAKAAAEATSSAPPGGKGKGGKK